jgi:aspartyl-tRNA(Asn)/glutamyl-tRNA(Gln) amidotransferase subunit A
MTRPSDSQLPTRRSFPAADAASAAGQVLQPAFGHENDLAGLTIMEAGQLLRNKSVSPVDLTRACLKRIETYNPKLNAFITVTDSEALEAARAIEAEQERGKWRGPLHGIPIALKDNIDTAGTRTTAASGLFKDRVPLEDAEVVRKLKAAGAVLLGKLNLHEFASGGTSDVSYFGPVHNPWLLDHITGGSSGGSAAATAAGLCFGALGTDTLGSIRIPSSYCGVVGLKPTFGRVSLRGVIPLSWSLDHCGPICKTVEDSALLLSAIAGYDQGDPASVGLPVPDYTRAHNVNVSELRLGIPRSPFFEGISPEVAAALETAISVLRHATKSVTEVQLPQPAEPVPIMAAEAYAYHAQWIAKYPEQYQPLTRERLRGAAEMKANVYVDALRQMNLQRREIMKIFSSVDMLITPTMMRTAESFEESKNFDPLGTRNTSPFDVFGLPTITLPCGFSAAGLPIGLQISGSLFTESMVLALANVYERETEWHKRPVKLLRA